MTQETGIQESNNKLLFAAPQPHRQPSFSCRTAGLQDWKSRRRRGLRKEENNHMTSLVKRRVDQPIIFNARAVREELKAQFQSLEFWTCTLELKPSYQDSLVSFRRGQIFISTGSIHEPQQEVLDFKRELRDPESPISQLPIASLTFVLGVQEQGQASQEVPLFKKLCEITTGEINPETYKALQLFMVDLLLNTDGMDSWFNQREDPRWQTLAR